MTGPRLVNHFTASRLAPIVLWTSGLKMGLRPFALHCTDRASRRRVPEGTRLLEASCLVAYRAILRATRPPTTSRTPAPSATAPGAARPPVGGRAVVVAVAVAVAVVVAVAVAVFVAVAVAV